MEQSVLMSATTPLLLNVWSPKFSATWDLLSRCWNGDYCAPNGTVCPPVCHDPMPSQCMEGELTCDMGHYGGCWMGDFCHEDKDGFQCPPVCNWPAHSICQEGEVLCDMGIDANYCWMGDYCMPAGSECPAPAM